MTSSTSEIATSARYLPFAVVGKKETRIAFDASAKINVSKSLLYDILHSGACFLLFVESMQWGHIRFRLCKFGVVADTQQVFLQIIINKCPRGNYHFCDKKIF